MHSLKMMFFAVPAIASAEAALGTEIMGSKWPNAPLPGESLEAPAHEGLRMQGLPDLTLSDDFGPVDAPAVLPDARDHVGGFTSMLPFVLPSPDQKDAGSCLYMATTGAAEWWLARTHFYLSRDPDGPVDLSERFAMNVAHWMPGFASSIDSWITDSIELFNAAGGAMLNRDYRYTKGWYIRGPGTSHQPSNGSDYEADYGTPFNWIAGMPAVGGDMVRLPRFRRELLFVDKNKDRWAVNSAPEDAVDRVKDALVKHEAPIIVTYNHYGIWHSVLVVGFNDTADTRGCRFTRRFPDHMLRRARLYERKASTSAHPEQKRKYLARARYFRRQADDVRDALQSEGGCREKGMFFVRDSIYPHSSEPLYDYDPDRVGEESHYSARVVLREYAWLERLANHAVQILAK